MNIITSTEEKNDSFTCLTTPTYTIVYLSVISPVIISTVFGNILILYSLCKFSSFLKGSMYILIGNLAVGDLLLGVGSVLFPAESIFPELSHNEYFCKIRASVMLVSSSVSLFTLMLMSIDRFMAVVFPLKHLTHSPRKGILCTCVSFGWLVSIAAGCVPFIVSNGRDENEQLVCRNGVLFTSKVNLLASAGVLFGLVFITLMYAIIACKLKRRRISLNGTRPISKSTKLTLNILVFVWYTFCWIPFLITTILIWSHTAADTSNVICIREYLVLLVYSNSGLNWIIYGLANRKFRIAFKAIAPCKNKLEGTMVQSPLSA